MKTSRTAAAVLLAAAGLLFTSVPANAAPCPAGYHWVDQGAMGSFCSADTSGGIGSGSGYYTVDLGGGNTVGQAPAAPPAPAYQAPAPVYQAPAPVYQAPAPAYQAPAPAYHAPAPAYQAPVYQAPANSSVPNAGAGYQAPAQVQVAVPQVAPAAGVDAGAPAEAAPAADVPAEATPAPTATPDPTGTSPATAMATPASIETPSTAPSSAAVPTEQASSTATFNPVPLLVIGGVLLAAALAWFVRPVRSVAARLVTRKGDR